MSILVFDNFSISRTNWLFSTKALAGTHSVELAPWTEDLRNGVRTSCKILFLWATCQCLWYCFASTLMLYLIVPNFAIVICSNVDRETVLKLKYWQFQRELFLQSENNFSAHIMLLYYICFIKNMQELLFANHWLILLMPCFQKLHIATVPSNI